MRVRCRILVFIITLVSLACLDKTCAIALNDVPDRSKEPKAGFRLVRVFQGGKKDRMNFALSPDGKLLATTHQGALRLWDVKSGKEIRRTIFKEVAVSTPVFVEQGKAVVCSVMNDVFLLEVPSLKERVVFHPITEGGDTLGCMEAHQEGSTLVMGTSRYLMLFDLRTGKAKWRTSFPCPSPEALNSPGVIALSPDKRTVAVALIYDGTIRLLDTDTGKEHHELKEPPPTNGHVIGLAFFPDGRTLAAAKGPNNRLTLWETDTGRVSRFLSWRTRERPAPELGPEAQMAYIRHVREHPDGVVSTAISPDGKTVAAASVDGILRLWEVSTGRLRHERKMDIYDFQFSLDGRYLATNGRLDHKVSLWSWHDPGSRGTGSLEMSELEQLWGDLAKQDAAVAYRAIARLSAAPAQAVDLLGRHLRRIEPTSLAEMDRLLADLNAEDFQIRKRASRLLEMMGTAAESRLRQALKDTSSVESRARIRRLLARLQDVHPDQLRFMRAVEILELIGTPEAARVLRPLAAGASGARETEDAIAALHRLRKSFPASP